MGSVKKNLYKGKLPEREKHHSRLFVDLAENIHIHHREFRTVFSLNEYFEYVDIITKSTNDVRNFLVQNPDYTEGKYPTTLMIAGGKERQLAFLKNSKKPNKSDYYSNDFAIELQDEYVTDEIHIHYRDFRIGIDRSCFREVAKGFNQALEELNNFELDNIYKRKTHSDRVISDFNSHNKKNVEIRGCPKTKNILSKIKSASEEDWGTEYLDSILSIILVSDLSEAIKHISQYGSGHTDVIVTENIDTANIFLRRVDSSSVMHNASSRFADGFEYGLGAEVGISTDKLHARGPVGLEGLTSQKYVVFGDGQIRQ